MPYIEDDPSLGFTMAGEGEASNVLVAGVCCSSGGGGMGCIESRKLVAVILVYKDSLSVFSDSSYSGDWLSGSGGLSLGL